MNESEFQRKCDEFVYREVYCNVSEMTEYILKKSIDDPDAPFSNDDIENQMQSGELEWDGELITFDSQEELDEWKSEMEDKIESGRESELDALSEEDPDYDEILNQITGGYDNLLEILDERCREAEYMLEEYKEISEYWVCSPWLIARLSERNEAVIPLEQIWCRCTTGQSISIDGVIREIVREYILTNEEKSPTITQKKFNKSKYDDDPNIKTVFIVGTGDNRQK